MPTPSHKSIDDTSPPIIDGDSESAGNFAGNSAHKPETTLNGHFTDSAAESVGNSTHTSHSIHSNGSSSFAGIVGTFPNKNIFKIGDYAKTDDDIVVITEVREDYISGLDKDRNPIGGHSDSFTIASIEEFAATQGELDDEWN